MVGMFKTGKQDAPPPAQETVWGWKHLTKVLSLTGQRHTRNQIHFVRLRLLMPLPLLLLLYTPRAPASMPIGAPQ